MGVGTLAVAGIGVAVKASADFEKEISKFNAAAQESPEILEEVRQKALQIGRDTSFGAGEAASAITNLSYAGLSTTEILEGAADAAVSLAEAGELEIPQAASIMSAAMNSFGIAAEDATGVADTMIGVFANSDTMVNELGEALQNVSATASTAGVSLEDTTVALGLLADKGIKGGKAGTTLNRMLLNLQPATNEAAGAMRELGLITEDGANQFFDAEGNMKSLSDVSETLQGSMEGLTKEQKLAYMETIFGSRALSAANALADAGSEGFSELANSMGEVAAADVASDKLDNLSGSMTILKGTIETALIGVGAPLQDVLKGVVDAITGVINAFANLPKGVQKFLTIGALVLGLVTGVAGAFLMLLGFLPAIMGGFATLTGVLLPVIAPFLAIVAAVALVAAGLVMLWKKSETFQNIVKTVFDAVTGFFSNAFGQIGNLISAFIDGDMWAVSEVLDNIFGDSGKLIPMFRSFFEFLQVTWTQIQEVFRAALDAITAIVSWFVEQVQAFWDRFGAHILAAAQRIFGNLLKFFKATWENIRQVIDGVLRVIKGIFDVFAGIFTGDWKRVWKGIKGIFSGVWSAIHGILSQIWATIEMLIRNGLEFIKTAIGAALALISQIWSGIWHGIATFFSSIWNGIRDALAAAWNWFIDRWKRGIANIKKAAVRGFTAVLDYIKSIPGKFVDGLGNIGSMLWGVGKKAMTGLGDGIRAMISKVTDIAGRVKDKIKEKLNPANWFSTPEEHYRNLWGSAFEAIGDEGKRKVRALGSVASDISSTLNVQPEGAFTSPMASTTANTINLNGDLVLPNIRSGEQADELLANLRQVARQGVV